MSARLRTQEGATAVLVALLAVVLFGVGAFAVDLGQAYSQKHVLQTDADMAVLAAGAKLPDEAASESFAESYLVENDLNRDIAWNLDCSVEHPTSHSTELDGCLEFEADGNPWKLRLWAPVVNVEYGLAKVLGSGFDDVDVPARAAVEIRTPDTGVMPAFAVGGCDYGPETLLDPTGGPPANLALYNGSPPYNDAELAEPLVPEAVDLNTTGQNLVINGINMAGATEVAFSLDGGTPFDGGHVLSTPSAVTATSVTVPEIPATVTDTEGAWYVRVKKSTGRWSDPDEAPVLLVGSAFLECDSGPTDGNFGTLLLPRSDGGGTDQQLAKNMIHGLEFTLAPYDGASSPWTCQDGDGEAVVSVSPPFNDGTNCVDTDTGFAQNGATMGLITGVDGEPGRLNAAENPTSDLCTPAPHSLSDWEYVKGPGEKFMINNDALTCFLTNDTTTLGQLDATYTGPSVLSEEIFDSPRFMWVPVLGVDPDSGGSNMYQIVEFRPAFITDQSTSSTRTTPNVGASGDTDNGIKAGPAGIEQLKVVFFSPEALPDTIVDFDGTVPYLGVGTKVLQLVE